MVFPAWEFLQLYRRRKGNKSARTMSQYVVYRIKEGSKFYLFSAVGFPVLLVIIGVWLLLHWEGLCYWQGWLCELSKRI